MPVSIEIGRSDRRASKLIAEYRAVTVGAATVRRSIEVAITGLEKFPTIRKAAIRSVEGVKHGQGAAQSELKERAIAVGATILAGAVEIAVAGLDQTGKRLGTIRICAGTGRGCEGVEASEGTSSRDLKNRTCVIGAASVGSAVEIAIGGLDQPIIRYAAIGPIEGMHYCKSPAGGDFEDGSIVIGTSAHRCPIEIAIRSLEQIGI